MDFLFSNLWKIGSCFRNPSLWVIYENLKKSEDYTLAQLKEMQFQKLQILLDFAFEYSKFYNRLFEANNFNPKIHFNSLDDLKRIPILEKSDLIKYNKDIHTDFKFKKSFYSETSGSSGQVLKFYKDEYWDSFNRASIMRGYSWYLVKPWEKNGYLWGYNIAPWKRMAIQFFDYAQNRFRLFSYDNDSVREFIRKLKTARYLSGYSSMIYEVAKAINRDNIDTSKIKLKMIKGTSEKIYESYQSEVKNAFGKRIISEYGAAEAGIIAFECREGNMHINMEGVYVEEIDNEIVVTNLIGRSFPVIRYKLGDFIKLKPESFQCPCGLAHPIIEDVLGRVGKVVYGKTKNFPSLVFYYVFKNLALNNGIELNYQAVQEEKGKIVLRIEQSLSIVQEKNLISVLDKYFSDDLDVKIEDGAPLHSYKGKLVDFISNVLTDDVY